MTRLNHAKNEAGCLLLIGLALGSAVCCLVGVFVVSLVGVVS